VDAEELRLRMPAGSLLETIHYLAAHYYDAGGLLHSKDATATNATHQQLAQQDQENSDEEESNSEFNQDPTSSISSKGRNQSMLRAIEGSALVALGVFLEETTKHEMTAKPSNDLHERADEEHKQVERNLIRLRESMRRSKKKRQAEQKSVEKVEVKHLENGWAKRPKKRRTEPSGPAKATMIESSEEEE